MTLYLRLAGTACCALTLIACGGGNALDNPPKVLNAAQPGGQRLSFAYFQRCVMPVLEAQLAVRIAGTLVVNSCASAGCHDDSTGTGGALRLRSGAAPADLAGAAANADLVRATEMYRNFYSAQGEVVFGDALASRLIAKPLVLNVLHGGGIVFESVEDPNLRLLRYWIEHPMPQGHDEFSSAGNGLFTPADAVTGQCNTE